MEEELLKWQKICKYLENQSDLENLKQIARGNIENYKQMDKKELCEKISKIYAEKDFWANLFPFFL